MSGICMRRLMSKYSKTVDIHTLTFEFIRYTVLQLFSKFGKISNLDFLFHKSGPLKGKPRGYAFIEFTDEGVSRFLQLHFLADSTHLRMQLKLYLQLTASWCEAENLL